MPEKLPIPDRLVIAIGGNDALQNMDLLSLRVASSAEALQAFADRLFTFERAYRGAIREAMARLETYDQFQPSAFKRRQINAELRKQIWTGEAS